MQTIYASLEDITQRRKELEKEIDLKEECLAELTNQLFTVSPPKSQTEALVQYAQSAVWIFDGVMTGIRIVRRFRNFFGSKKKK
ncbi:MAG: hypothetical protein ACRC8J_07150 [Phocaeicola sp.]